jgi:hypothetical protein
MFLFDRNNHATNNIVIEIRSSRFIEEFFAKLLSYLRYTFKYPGGKLMLIFGKHAPFY